MAQPIVVEVLTLDSKQCPCCWFMLELLTELPPEVQEVIAYREWSLKTREGIAAYDERGGRVIPTLCIDGRRVFESLIPTFEELYQALLAAAHDDEQRGVLGRALDEARQAYE